MPYIFTYGTLMRGESRNHLLRVCGLNYKCDYRLNGYEMYHYPKGDFPFILPTRKKENGCYVVGELWEVNEEYLPLVLLILNRIEAEGKLYFLRKTKCNLSDIISRHDNSGRDMLGKAVFFYEGNEKVWRNEVSIPLENGVKWTSRKEVKR